MDDANMHTIEPPAEHNHEDDPVHKDLLPGEMLPTSLPSANPTTQPRQTVIEGKQSREGWKARREVWEEEGPIGATDDKRQSSEMRHRDTASAFKPRSSYYTGAPAIGSAFGTEPMGQIGMHYPREVVRIERDYSGGELVQFHSTFPLELEGRITPTQFLETINGINELLISAHDLTASCLDNTLAVLTLYLSLLIFDTHYEKQMRKLRKLIDDLNAEIYNPRGLNILWPRKLAFMFLEIEYY